MNNKTIESLVEIIGAETAENLLLDFVKRGWKNGTKLAQRVESGEVAVPKKPKRRRILGAKPWKDGEEERLETRVEELKAEGYNSINSIINKLASEFNRTPAALGVRLSRLHIKA